MITKKKRKPPYQMCTHLNQFTDAERTQHLFRIVGVSEIVEAFGGVLAGPFSN